MKWFKKFSWIAAVLTLGVSMSWSLPTITELLQKQDDYLDLNKMDLTAKVNFTQQKVNQGVKTYESIFYRRDRNDDFLMITIAPDSDKGNGYLKVGDNMWMYRVNTRTFQHINRDESINGTDIKSGDIEKRKLTELYVGAKDGNGKEIITEEMLGKIPVYKFEVTAKVNDVTYPKRIFWVRKDNFLPLKIQDYSLSKTLMYTEYFPKYTTVEGRYIWLQLITIDEFEKGNKTIIELSGISFQRLDDSMFTKAYLENLSK